MEHITHLFTFFEGLGGVQSVLKLHHERDSSLNLDSQFLIYFDKGTPVRPRVTNLGFNRWTTIEEGRRRFPSQATRGRGCIYLNLWGLPMFADLDGASRRMGILHTDLPDLEWQLGFQTGLLDSIACISQPLVQLAKRRFPELAENRVHHLPLPISKPISVPAPALKALGEEVVIGFAGRVIKEQKRVDRLAEFVKLFKKEGLPFRLEILGDGPQLPWLKSTLAEIPGIRFHGHQTGEHYWNRLAGWDFILFTSDYEGLPLSLLESMSLGVIPLYPRILSGGDEYATKADPGLLYELSQPASIVRYLKNFQQRSPDQQKALRLKCQQLVAPHTVEAYLSAFARFVAGTLELPRISPEKFRPRPFFWSDCVPFGILRRLYLRGFFNRSRVHQE